MEPDQSALSSAGSEKSARSWICVCLPVCLPYLRDLLLMFSAAAVAGAARQIGPAAPGFFCHDPGITYPSRGDSISVVALAILTVLLPFVVTLSTELAVQRHGWGWDWRRPLWLTAVLTARHLSCQALLFAVTELVKCLVSRPRPCFLELCRPTGYNESLCSSNRFISEFHCAALDSADRDTRVLINDSMLSFPSSHAAISACTATFLAVYLVSRTAGRRRAVLRLWLCACCVLYAAGVGLSRVADYRHRLTDVLGGSCLGVAAGAVLCCISLDKLASQHRLQQRRPLLPQMSVLSNRTSDTQTTSGD